MEGVIHLEIGDPGFPTPVPIVEAAERAAREGRTGYTPSAGLPELRQAVAERLSEELGAPCEPEEIVITAGAMEALLLSILATVNPGDEVIVPSPSWPNYLAHVQLAGGRYCILPLEEEDGFVLNVERLKATIGERTKGLILNSPQNPTGAVLSKEQLGAIAEVAIEHDLLVYADEAYEAIIYGENEASSIASLPGMKERTVIVRSFSKTYAMTGWRIGYLVCEKSLAYRIARLHEHTSACTNALAQYAALAALQLPEETVKEMVAIYQRRRDLLLSQLRAVPFLTPIPPQGTFYMFVRLGAGALSSYEFARKLLMEGRVAVAPGTAFGKEGEGYIRLSFASADGDELSEAVQRMACVLEGETIT